MIKQTEHINNGSRALVIVDPQIDFITGVLPVPCAEDAAKRYGRKMINILNRYSPSLDGGETLAYF